MYCIYSLANATSTLQRTGDRNIVTVVSTGTCWYVPHTEVEETILEYEETPVGTDVVENLYFVETRETPNCAFQEAQTTTEEDFLTNEVVTDNLKEEFKETIVATIVQGSYDVVDEIMPKASGSCLLFCGTSN
jgi:hypothetical protein